VRYDKIVKGVVFADQSNFYFDELVDESTAEIAAVSPEKQ
jgi:hypothetical protein